MAEPLRKSRPDAASQHVDGAPIRLVIFDFDGTLSDSAEWFLSVIDPLAAKFKFRTVSDAEIEMLRHRPTRDVISYLGIPNWKLPFIARYIRKLVYQNAGKISLFDGIDGLLAELAETGVRIALVTSNAEANARAILGEANAARIEIWSCGSSLYGKAPKFRKVLKRAGVAPEEAIAIGDETRDIDSAREVGMRAGSVLWGYASEEALCELKPDALFREPGEIVAFVKARRPG